MNKKENIDIYFDLFMELTNKLNEDVCLKGNILLNKLYKERARATKDLDMDIKVSKIIYRDKVVPLLREFADKLIKRGLADRYKVRNENNDKTMGGILVFKSGGDNKKDVIVYSADINLGNSLFGDKIYVIGGCEFRGYSLERVLCDKIIATLMDTEKRRVKDYYDILLIMRLEPDIDFDKVIKYIVQKQKGVDDTLTLFKNVLYLESDLMILYDRWEDFNRTELGSININTIGFSEMYNSYTRVVSKIEQLIMDKYKEGELKW